MISRCNNPEHPRYNQYGGVGVSVCDRWLEKENFISDVKQLSGYNEEALLSGKLHLDKDIGSGESRQYSPETCAFTDLATNNKHKPNQMEAFRAISPDGITHVASNQSDFAKARGLKQSKISDCLSNKAKHHRGWTFEKE